MTYFDLRVDAPDSGSDPAPNEPDPDPGQWRLVFDFYEGEQIIGDSIRYAVTDALRTAFENAHLTGVEYRPMSVARGDQFELVNPHVTLPHFWELVALGAPDHDDIALARGLLHVSEKALATIRLVGDSGVRAAESLTDEVAGEEWYPGSGRLPW